MEEGTTVRRVTRQSARITRNISRNSVKHSRRSAVLELEESASNSTRRESDSSTDLPSERFSNGRISRADHRDDGDLWNRSSQTEGISSTEEYSKTLDVLRDFRMAKESFLDCTAVKFLRRYSRETDEKAKTGYTYASGLSYSPNGDPNTPMPNMSRYSLDHYARCTENGTYDYSRAESAMSRTSRLDFADSSRSSLTSTPEPSWSIRDYLTMLYKRTTTTNTHTNTHTNTNTEKTYEEEEGGASSRSRMTPESRSGNDFSERRERSYLSSSALDGASSSYSTSADWNDSFRNENQAVSRTYTRTYTPASTSPTYADTSPTYAGTSRTYADTSRTYVGTSPTYADTSRAYADTSRAYVGTSPTYVGTSPTYAGTSRTYVGTSPTYADTSRTYAGTSRTYTPASAEHLTTNYGASGSLTSRSLTSGYLRSRFTVPPVETAVERITRRFIDVVTRRTITKTETVRQQSDERRRGLGLCWLLPLFLLLLLPLLACLWWLTPLGVRDSATTAQSVVSTHHLSSHSFHSLQESQTEKETFTNTTNQTTPLPQVIYVKESITCPVAKDCCDDVQLVKAQVALILNRLETIRGDDRTRDEWQKDRESTDVQTRLAIDELRQMLLRVEKEIVIRGEIVPQFVREREKFSLEDVRRVVTDSIRRYDEDKTGEPDHALESSGATVISTRCSEDYKWGHTQLSLFGIPIPFTSWTTSPRLAIQADMRPGQCWAFKGDEGYIVIQLTGNVRPTSFTVEHLPKNLSPTGKIDSAPKDFEVYGLVSEQGPGYILGKYTYEDNGYSLQNFQIQTKLEPEDTFPFVELRITSNHGHPDYTCLYRFRVHGRFVKGDL